MISESQLGYALMLKETKSPSLTVNECGLAGIRLYHGDVFSSSVWNLEILLDNSIPKKTKIGNWPFCDFLKTSTD